MMFFTALLVGVALATPSLQKAEPKQLLELLERPNANKHLIKTIVECLDMPNNKPSALTFLRCLNDRLHVYQKTVFDSIGFILGNYVIKAASMAFTNSEGSLLDRATAFGDCLPMLLRNLFGLEEYSFSCKKRSVIEGYDNADDSDFEQPDSDDEL